MVIWRAIGRSAAWPIFYASLVDRLTPRRDMAVTSLRSFCGEQRQRSRRSRTPDMRRLSSDREEPPLSVSVGIAVYPEDGTTIETLFHAADRGLYNMKQRRQQEMAL